MSTIREKIHKLLMLSTSPNQFEADLARKRATELMAKYNISAAEVLEENPPEGVGSKTEVQLQVSRLENWVWILATMVASRYGVEGCYRPEEGWIRIWFYGVEGDTRDAAQTFSAATSSIEKLADEVKVVYTEWEMYTPFRSAAIGSMTKEEFETDFRMSYILGLLHGFEKLIRKANYDELHHMTSEVSSESDAIVLDRKDVARKVLDKENAEINKSEMSDEIVNSQVGYNKGVYDSYSIDLSLTMIESKE